MPPTLDERAEGQPPQPAQAAEAASDDARCYQPVTDFNGVTVGLYPAPVFEGAPQGPQASESLLVTPFGRQAGPAGEAGPDLGVHLHLHFVDLLHEMAHYLKQVPFPFTLYVSVTDPEGLERVKKQLRGALPAAQVEVRLVANRGRDLGPFVSEFAQALARHDFIAHIHGKRSEHSTLKADWRRQLMANLMGSPAAVRSVFSAFAADPLLGMIFPVYHQSLRQQISWGNNLAACQRLAARLNLSIEAHRMALFPAGSMFWARTSALRGLFDAGLAASDFPEESGQLDGTPAHALERLLGTLVVDRGGRLLQIRNERPYTRRCFDPPGRWRLANWFRRG